MCNHMQVHHIRFSVQCRCDETSNLKCISARLHMIGRRFTHFFEIVWSICTGNYALDFNDCALYKKETRL